MAKLLNKISRYFKSPQKVTVDLKSLHRIAGFYDVNKIKKQDKSHQNFFSFIDKLAIYYYKLRCNISENNFSWEKNGKLRMYNDLVALVCTPLNQVFS